MAESLFRRLWALEGASGGPRPLAGLQVARALAAGLVTLHHALETSNGVRGSFSPDWLTTAGAAGVDIFFVISGFIMAYTSFGPGRTAPRPAAFLRRRATRIYPLYWLVCLAMLSLMAMGFFQKRMLGAGDVVLALALLPGGQPIVGVAWTLVYEVYFYLVFAACLAARSYRFSVLGTSGAILLIWLGAHGLPGGPIRAFLTDPIPLEFLFGLWLAAAYPRIGARWRGSILAPALIAGGLALIHAAPLLVPHETTHGLQGLPRVMTWGLAGAAMVAGFLAVVGPRNRAWSLAVVLGDASYSLYLTHVFVLMGYGLALRHPTIAAFPQYYLVPAIVIAATAAGVACHFLLEKPLLALVRGVANRRSAKAPAPADRSAPEALV